MANGLLANSPIDLEALIRRRRDILSGDARIEAIREGGPEFRGADQRQRIRDLDRAQSQELAQLDRLIRETRDAGRTSPVFAPQRQIEPLTPTQSQSLSLAPGEVGPPQPIVERPIAPLSGFGEMRVPGQARAAISPSREIFQGGLSRAPGEFFAPRPGEFARRDEEIANLDPGRLFTLRQELEQRRREVEERGGRPLSPQQAGAFTSAGQELDELERRRLLFAEGRRLQAFPVQAGIEEAKIRADAAIEAAGLRGPTSRTMDDPTRRFLENQARDLGDEKSELNQQLIDLRQTKIGGLSPLEPEQLDAQENVISDRIEAINKQLGDIGNRLAAGGRGGFFPDFSQDLATIPETAEEALNIEGSRDLGLIDGGRAIEIPGHGVQIF